MQSNRPSIQLAVEQQYVKEVCQNQVINSARAKTYDEEQQVLYAIVRDYVCYQAALLHADKIPAMQVSLQTESSPESLVANTVKKNPSIPMTINLIQKKKESEALQAIETRINDLSQLIVDMLSIKTKRAILLNRAEQRKKAALKAQGNQVNDLIDVNSIDKKVVMSLERNLNLLYSQDMVQHLIRLRLHDVNIQPSYMLGEQAAIDVGNRIWLGLYDLSHSTDFNLQQSRREFAKLLTERLNTLTADERQKEICVSVRNFTKNGDGHYTLLTLQPDPENQNQYVMHSINSISPKKDKLIVHGMEGEFKVVAENADFKISRCQYKQLICQPTGYSSGLAHVEMVSAVMTQTCLFGRVNKNYMKRATIQPTDSHLLHASNVHYCDLLTNEVTKKAIIDRSQADSIFKLVIPGKKQNEFGFVPPSVAHLQVAKIISSVDEEKLKAKVQPLIIEEKSKIGAGFLSFLGLGIMAAPVVVLACLTPLSIGILAAIGVGCFIVGALMMVYGLNVIIGSKHSEDDSANHPTHEEVSTYSRLNRVPSVQPKDGIALKDKASANNNLNMGGSVQSGSVVEGGLKLGSVVEVGLNPDTKSVSRLH